MQAGKTGAKTSTKKAKTATRGSRTTRSNLLKSLPESVEHIEIVQQVAGVLEELQSRVSDVKEEANKELKKLMKLYEGNYKGLEKKVHQITTEAKKQAQTSMLHLLQKWHEHKEKLPAPLTKEIEKLVGHLGQKAAARKKSGAKPGRKSGSQTTAKSGPKPKASSKTADTNSTSLSMNEGKRPGPGRPRSNKASGQN